MMQYIPQGPPFQMIDTLIKSDANTTVCSFSIPTNHLFINDADEFMEAGIIEHMAQTAAAGSGYKASLSNQAPQVGFIGAIKDFRLHCFPKVGETITTTITVKNQIGNVQVVEASTQANETAIAQAEFKIFIQE